MSMQSVVVQGKTKSAPVLAPSYVATTPMLASPTKLSSPAKLTVAAPYVAAPQLTPVVAQAPQVRGATPMKLSTPMVASQFASASPPRTSPNPLVSASSFHSTTSSRPLGVTYSTPSYVHSGSHVVQSPISLSSATWPRWSDTNGDQNWLVVATDRLWPHAARYICKQMVSNFDDDLQASEAKLEEMAKELASMPPKNPFSSTWINFMLKMVWQVVHPSASKAVKEMLKPKLHNALAMLAPVDIDPCILGTEPPEMDEIQIMEDQGLGHWMDLKIHVRWHCEPDITVSCKLGSVSLPKLKVGFTMYLGLQGETEEPPFFNAAVLYMGNGFAHARDVLNTPQAKKDPYIGMEFSEAWAGFSVSLVEDAVVSTLNSVITQKMVLPNRMVIHNAHTATPHDLLMPKPHGCLQLTVKGVSGLIGTEWKLQSILTGSRSNDPYVTVELANGALLRTPTCYNELNPTWEEGNTYHFVIDSVRLQHFNLEVYDDGLLQMFREQQIGFRSKEHVMARRLGISIVDLFGKVPLDFFDREQQVEKSCELDMSWEGEKEGKAEELKGQKAELHLGLHWRPIIVGQPSTVPSAVFLEDDEPEPVWPHFVMRLCLQSVKMEKFKGKQTDEFFIKVTVMPGFDAEGSHQDEPKEIVSKKVKPSHLDQEDRTELVSRMTGGRLGRANRVATFDQAFRFMVRDPRSSKVHLSFHSQADFDKTETSELGELTLEVNSLLKEKDLALEIKNEVLDNWIGEVPARFSGHLQLFQLGSSRRQQAAELGRTKTKSLEKQKAQMEAQQLVQRASSLRAEAENLERQARAKDSDHSRKQKGGRNLLKVRVISARGLRAADFTLTRWGTSDPYCVCELAGRNKKGFQTQVLQKTLEPYWDYEGAVQNYKSGMALKFSVYDRDFSYKDDLLGTVTLSASEFHPNGFTGELPLQDVSAAAGQESFIQLEIADIHGDFPADEKEGEGRLKVKIVGGRGFMEDSVGLMGRTTTCLYATCEIVGKSRTCMRTQAIEHTGEPDWEYERQMRNFKPGDVLQFKVYQEKSSLQDVCLMTYKMKSEEFYPQGFAGLIDLEAPGDGWLSKAAGSPKRLGRALSKHEGQKQQLEVLISDSEGKYPKLELADSKLQVRILSARNLMAADVYLLQEQSSDPYCKCEVVGRSRSRFRTKTVEKKLSPVWNHQHRMRGYEQGDALKFTVFDEDYVSQDDELGSVVLQSEEFHRNGFLGELRLSGEKESYLKVQISNGEGVFTQGVQEEKDNQVSRTGMLKMVAGGMDVLKQYICRSKEQS